ncbi:helix-turn-helix transcriptional regulator [Brevibacillus ruminantium]|uniref:Helix-turn-helix transcriptional regulator n=1 Tax=Brevibacillus ruminantium TaxID=2950604 RepID=A0ABY4WI51_9BACL|nr:helix-turn-helix transcriptional regulator [Brevibacillus ruminantium]USG65828.1 helix-turn-helix transcriptional regulator [Brevibacillus ruminantium]
MALQENLQSSLRLEIERKQRQYGYTLSKLSKLSGINHGHLSDIFRGNRPMTIGQLDALAVVFGQSPGWLYQLYVDECFTNERVSRPRVMRYLIRCAEIGEQSCVEQVVSKLLDNRKNVDILFSVAEKLFESGKRKESIPFYQFVVDSEKDSHSDRFVISQYRLFRAMQGENMEENWRAIIRFEPYRNRLPENYQLDGLLHLANACFMLQEWKKVEKYADELRSLAMRVYQEELSKRKNGKICGPLRTERHLVVYYGQGFLAKGVALQMQGLYREAKLYVKGYADLGWFELLDGTGYREVEKFKIWAKANSYTYDLLMGQTNVLPEYLEFLAKHPEEIPAGLLTIMEAASKYDILINPVLEQYAEEIERFYNYNDQVNISRQYQFRYHKMIYELKNGFISNAIEEILYCLDLSDKLRNQQAFKRCTALFWEYRQQATEKQKRIYHEIIGRYTE